MTTVGVCVPQLGPTVTAPLVRDFAQQAEAMGFAGLWVQDHFLFALSPSGAFGGSGDRQPAVYQSVWQPTELLAALSCWTKRAELGTSVLVAGNHWPAQLAARLATVDQLGGGRLAVLGLGVGWSAEEMHAVGVDPRTRGRRMDDFVQVLRACWGPDPAEYHGSLLQIGRSISRPKPASSPLLMSGMHSKRGLARTARDFDLWNPTSVMPIPDIIETVEAMNACRPSGKQPLDVCYRLAQTDSAGRRLTVDEVLDHAHQGIEAGFGRIILETNYDADISDAGDWLAALAALEPVLDLVNRD